MYSDNQRKQLVQFMRVSPPVITHYSIFYNAYMIVELIYLISISFLSNKHIVLRVVAFVVLLVSFYTLFHPILFSLYYNAVAYIPSVAQQYSVSFRHINFTPLDATHI